MDWFFLAIAHWHTGDKQEARKWFDKGVTWTKANDLRNTELRQFWGEAAELLRQPGPDASRPDATATLTRKAGPKNAKKSLNARQAEERTTQSVSRGLHRTAGRIEWQGNHIFHTAFSPDGKLCLAGGDTGTLRVWEVASGNQVLELPVNLGLFTPDGKQLIATRVTRRSRYLTCLAARPFAWEASSPVVSMAIAPDGKRLVSGHADNLLRVWEFDTGKLLWRLQGHVEPALPVFSPDGKEILSGSKDKTIRLWNVETGKLVRTYLNFKGVTAIEGHDLIVQAFFLPDGQQVVGSVWGVEKTLLVLDKGSGIAVRTLDLGADEHKELAISPDGRWLLTGHDDRTVRLRSLATGEEVQRFELADVNVPRAQLLE